MFGANCPLDQAEGPAEIVDIRKLRAADSPRLLGESDEAIQTLAQTDGVLPPIVVHRPSMKIIDGMHRYRAALLRQASTMEVRYYDGDAESAFALAVRANMANGLPLSLADRRSAAGRLIRSQPHWSSRAIADLTGLAAKTVDSIRRSSGEETQLSIKRLGRDGRLRPVDCTEGRRRVSEAIRRRPDATLRQIADEVGVSVGTVRDVRTKIRNGEDPILPRRRRDSQPSAASGASEAIARLADGSERDQVCVSIRQQLCRDPAVRMSESGRSLVRWLEARGVSSDELRGFVEGSPPHCRTVLASLARHYSEMWSDYANALEHALRPERTALGSEMTSQLRTG
ncbi:MAG: ParB N-terminal domain-containing protein [Streptosporangiaceae bacterium]